MIELPNPLEVKTATRLDVVSFSVVRAPVLSMAIAYQLYDADGAPIGAQRIVGVDTERTRAFLDGEGSVKQRVLALAAAIAIEPAAPQGGSIE